jgi:CRP/FNR family transcriptional regulator
VYKSDGRLPLPTSADLFADILGEQLCEILDAAVIREIAAHHLICREGAPPANVFLLKSGRAKFYRLSRTGDEVLLSVLVPGDTFGLGTLLAHPRPYIGTAETTRDSEFLVWKHARIRTLAQKYPRLAQNALGIVLSYLATHYQQLFDLLTCTAEERLAGVIVQLGHQTGLKTPTGVEINATNEELGAQAKVSPFTVSRLLSRWTDAGVLRKTRGRIFLNHPERLLGD